MLADHDRNGVGQAAAEECKQRWLDGGAARRGADALGRAARISTTSF